MVTTTRGHLTAARTPDVQTFESAVRRFTVDRAVPNDCEVTFFEVEGDHQLHVNVTHKYETAAVKGWAGPGRLQDGFVYNRRFGDGQPLRVIRHIRDMVCAERV